MHSPINWSNNWFRPFNFKSCECYPLTPCELFWFSLAFSDQLNCVPAQIRHSWDGIIGLVSVSGCKGFFWIVEFPSHWYLVCILCLWPIPASWHLCCFSPLQLSKRELHLNFSTCLCCVGCRKGLVALLDKVEQGVLREGQELTELITASHHNRLVLHLYILPWILHSIWFINLKGSRGPLWVIWSCLKLPVVVLSRWCQKWPHLKLYLFINLNHYSTNTYMLRKYREIWAFINDRSHVVVCYFLSLPGWIIYRFNIIDQVSHVIGACTNCHVGHAVVLWNL